MVYAEAVSESGAPSVQSGPDLGEREDFRATSDPALTEAGDRGRVELLDYRQLYSLWERQQWAVQDLDFTQDRDRLARAHRRRGALRADVRALLVLRRRAARRRGARADDARACPDEDMRIFLCTQIADEARHVAFFDRFYSEVGVLQADDLGGRLAETTEHLNPEFGVLFDELLRRRVDRLAQEPEDTEALVEAITIYHMVIEGMLALTGQHFIISYNERIGTLPAFVEGFTNVARDEHRHVAFGARFLRDMALADERYREAIGRTLAEVAPAAEGVLRPKWMNESEEDLEIFGVRV